MKFSILQQDLLPHLQAVSRSVGIRSTLPVLANVLIQAEKGKLRLSSTNLELGVIKEIKAKIEEEGEITVPVRTFLDIVSSLSGEELTVESQSDQLKIQTNRFNATLNGISASEFPAIPLSSDKSVELSAAALKKALPEITFAAASDDGRPILTGILTEIKKAHLELVATDGFRLAHKQAKLDGAQDHSFRVLIPRRTFEEVLRIIGEDLGKGEEDGQNIEISTSENQNQMIFKIGNTMLSSRLIEGQFPAWDKIIPQTAQNKTIIDRSELLKAVKLASVFAKDAANIVKMQTEKDKIVLTSEARELGGQQTSVEAQTAGETITIAFNSKFLIDALNACPSSQISIEFSGNLSPALIKPVGEDGLEYVIMPIRLS